MFSVLWTRDIQAEAIRVMRRNHPEWPGTAVEQRLAMIDYVIDETIVFPSADYNFTGADEGDFHIHAAAVAGKANFVLSNNQPRDITTRPDEEDYEVINADDFFNLVADSNEHAFLKATEGQLEYYSQPGRASGPIHSALERAGCPEFAKRVKRALGHIALRQ